MKSWPWGLPAALIIGAAFLWIAIQHVVPSAADLAPFVFLFFVTLGFWVAAPVAAASVAVVILLANLIWLSPGMLSRPEWWVAAFATLGNVFFAIRKQKSDAMLESVVNAVRIGIAAVDLHGRQIFVNNALCVMTGRERRELMGQTPPFAHWAPSRKAENTAALNRLAAGNSAPDTFDTFFCRPDGTEFPVRITASPIVDTAGKTTGWSAGVVDLSSQAASRCEQKREADLAEFVQAHFNVFRWRLVSGGTIQCSGPESADFLGRLATALVPVVANRDGGPTALTNAPLIGSRLLIDDASGRRRSFEILNVPGGLVPPGHGLLVEQTERWQREERAATAARFEVIARMAGQVWHDQLVLVNMVRTIAEDCARSGNNADLQAKARQMIAALDRVDAIGRPLMTSARQSTADAPPSTSVLILLDALKSLLTVALGTDIELVVRAPESDIVVAVPEPDLFRHLLNLVTNARDAMPDGGRLVIEACTSPDNSQLVIEVADTGIGIPRAQLERVWEHFFSTKGTDRGTGLGLPGVLAFANSHGGSAELRSAPGQGTTVTLRLPIATAADASVGSAAPPGSSVLLIEDDDVAARLLLSAIGKAGFTFSRAATIGQAEALLRLARPAVVISDLDVGGLPATDLLRRLSDEGGCRLVIISGFAARYDLAGIRATIIDKPVSPDAILAALRQAPPLIRTAGLSR